jgi:hypothetical protein
MTMAFPLTFSVRPRLYFTTPNGTAFVHVEIEPCRNRSAS